MPKRRLPRRENLKRSADELKTQLDDAKDAFNVALEELKKVELLDERDQLRERSADNGPVELDMAMIRARDSAHA